jgi:hypothetical protein
MQPWFRLFSEAHIAVSNALTFTGTDSTSFALPSSSDTVVVLVATQTLTNKTISGTSNTLSNIANSSLSHSTIGFTDSTGLFTVSGSPAALGGFITLSAFASQTANTILRSGSGTPSFSAMVVGDMPTSGTWAFAGTISGGLTFSGTPVFSNVPTLPNQSANIVFAGPSGGSSAAPAFRALVAADIPSTLNATTVNTTLTTLGNLVTTQISAPGTTVSVTTSGTSGSTTYTYAFSAVDSNGHETAVGSGLATTSGNATLSTSNYNIVTAPALPTGAVSMNCYRTTNGTTATATLTLRRPGGEALAQSSDESQSEVVPKDAAAH